MAKICTNCGGEMGGFFGLAVAVNNPNICHSCHMKALANRNQDPDFVAKQLRQAELRDKAEALAPRIIISTTSEIFGREIIDHLGIARGGTVRAKNAISDIGAGIKNVVGGELKAYTQLMADAREQALQRMQIDAVMMEADAVVGVNFSTSMIDVGAAEISAFGTAVKLKEIVSDE